MKARTVREKTYSQESLERGIVNLMYSLLPNFQ